MKKRQSNFELLRILCMFLIVGLHIVRQTKMDGYMPQDGINYYYCVLIGSAGRLVCNTFVMIGAWFLVDSRFKPERAVNLWLEILLYSATITAVCFVTGYGNATITKLVQACFPVFGRPVWFGAEYICLLLLTPWLNEMLDEKNQQRTGKIVILFGILITGCATLFPLEYTTPAFSELIWFCFLYLFIGLYKRRQMFVPGWFEKYSVLWFVLSYLFLCGIKVLADFLDSEALRRVFIHFYAHYEALLGFACSLALFLAFKNWDIGYNRFVNLISRSVFAVYIIHQTPAFYQYMWNGIFHVDAAAGQGSIVGYSLLVIAVIFAACVCIDNIRLFITERLVYKSRLYLMVCQKLQEFYNM